jgi:hypothetical protein
MLKELLEIPKEEIDNVRREVIQQQIADIEKELHEIKRARKVLYDSNNVVVTEHAIVRYFERVLGYDISEIKSHIVPQKTAEQIKICKTGLFPVNNFKLRVKKGTVVTLVKGD